MTALRRWLFGEPARERFREGDVIVRCPSCSSDLPCASVVILRTPVLRGREVVAIPSGERFACQNHGCAQVFSVGPTGVFRHDPRALPYIPQVAEPSGRSHPEPPTPQGAPRRPLLTPLERPE